MKRPLLFLLGFAVLPLVVLSSPAKASAPPLCTDADLMCPATTASNLARTLQAFPDPAISGPNARFAAPDYLVHKPINRTVQYSIGVRGTLMLSEEAFKTRVQQILDDPRGWSRLGVKFELVASGGLFTVVLSEAAQVPSFGAPCDTEYNCNVGNYVIVNENRWLQATAPWRDAGGSVANYQHLVINHELGHWLGHGHPACPAAGDAAPVMMQQSLDLGGCKFHAWPRDDEIWSTRLRV